MALDKDTVARIARLARVNVPDQELAPLAGELSDVTLPLRADKVTDGGIAAKVLANAPGGAVYIDMSDKNAGGFFTVPKVVE